MKFKVILQLLGLLLSTNVFATIHYVSNTGSNTAPYTSWATAGTGLQAVINASSVGDSVFVKAGTYYPNSYPPYSGTPTLTSRDYTFFVKDGVKIYGGFAGTETDFSQRSITLNVTILSGNIGSLASVTDNCWHVVTASASSAGGGGVTVDGFTIQEGHDENGAGSGGPTVNSNATERRNGQGIYILYGNNTITNNTVTNNINTYSGGSGAGIYVSSTPSIGNNIIQYNKIFSNSNVFGGGGLYVSGGTNNISYNEVYSNSALSNASGGGMYLNNGTFTVLYNSIHDNVATYFSTAGGGGGIYLSASPNVTNSIFRYNKIYNNSSGYGGGGAWLAGQTTGTIDFSYNFVYDNTTTSISYGGGGIYTGYGIITIYNNVFYGNSTTNVAGGGAFVNQTGNMTISNNTFYNNSAKTGGGGILFSDAFTTYKLNNNIFWANTYNGNNNVAYADFKCTGTTSRVNASNNTLQNIASGNYTYVTLTANKHTLDPLFVNTASPIGPDGLINTVDDGLHVKCTSPAIGAGATGTGIPIDDNVGLTRSTSPVPNGPTIGAYEQIGAEFLSLASAYTTLTKTQAGAVIYGDCATNLICTVTSTGASPISGSTTAKVWIEGTQPASWVNRHYEITPASNASTATGRVTLYFTQAEFDAFNAVNTIKLPTGPSDASGKANLMVEKRGGTSSNGTGLPSTYAGSPENINPNDANIVWSTSASRWQVTFDVTGFSGFWIKTGGIIIPVKWINFKGLITERQHVRLDWKVAENDVSGYEIEKSTDAFNFTKIGAVPAQGDGLNSYHFIDEVLTQKAYYHVKQIDNSGIFSYSAIILIQYKQDNKITLYPNPVADNLFISGVDSGTAIQLYNSLGKKIGTYICNSNNEVINLTNLSTGIYYIQAGNAGTYKVIKK